MAKIKMQAMTDFANFSRLCGGRGAGKVFSVKQRLNKQEREAKMISTTTTLTMPCIALTPTGKLSPDTRTNLEKQRTKLLWMNSLELLESAEGVDLTKLAHFLNQLATACEEQGDFAKTERLFQRLNRLVQRTGIDPEMETMRPIVLRRLGSLYQAQRRYREAEDLLHRALISAQTVFQTQSEEVAEIQHHLAMLHQEQGRFDKAAKYYWRALRIYQQVSGADRLRTGNLYHDLSSLERKRENVAEAEQLAGHALEIRMRVQGMTHPAVAAEMLWLADLMADQEKFNEAERLYRGAIGIIESACDDDHYDVANTLVKLAAIFFFFVRIAEAERCLLRAITIKERLFGIENLEVAQLQDQLAQLYGGQSRHDEAARFAHRAHTTFIKATGPLRLE